MQETVTKLSIVQNGDNKIVVQDPTFRMANIEGEYTTFRSIYQSGDNYFCINESLVVLIGHVKTIYISICRCNDSVCTSSQTVFTLVIPSREALEYLQDNMLTTYGQYTIYCTKYGLTPVHATDYDHLKVNGLTLLDWMKILASSDGIEREHMNNMCAQLQ